jgi:DNA modification methylase
MLNVSISDWTKERVVATYGTNYGSSEIPFQGWRHFKEAYTPELVERAVNESQRSVRRCLDPFGGSGTTALTCQFLGIDPLTVEVNPFLADLIEAKLCSYESDLLARDFGAVVSLARTVEDEGHDYIEGLPPTFVEPGVKDRWIFNKMVASKIGAYLFSIDQLSEVSHRRLFRVLLGGVLLQASNVVVYGKGRRYRKGWKDNDISGRDLDSKFIKSVQQAITDIHQYRNRSCRDYTLLRGDCLRQLDHVDEFDLAVFSPPYPNSFDYTDVYNVELWTLGYLMTSACNKDLRTATLCSHVQVARDYKKPPEGSETLTVACEGLAKNRDKLWDKNIPAMVGGYFSDMLCVIQKIAQRINQGGEIWMVVGDSKYAGVHISTADILRELADNLGLTVTLQEPFRSMRLSPQQGGNAELAETLLVVTS